MKYSILIAFILVNICQLNSQVLVRRFPANINPLVENFSGINCTFCVPNDEKQQMLINDNCKTSVVNYHAGSFAKPTKPSEPDLRTPLGDLLHNYFGIQSYPVSTTNRNGNFTNGGFVNDAKKIANKIAKVNVGIKTTYDSISRKIRIDVELFFSEDVADTSLLNVYINENNFKGYQLMPGGGDNFSYIHNHIFRKSLTSNWGTLISKTSKGSLVSFNFEEELDRAYKVENMEIVAFVNIKDKEILNSATVSAFNDNNAPKSSRSKSENHKLVIANNETFQYSYTIQSNLAEPTQYNFNITNSFTSAMKYVVSINNVSLNSSDSIVFGPLELKEIKVSISQGDSPGYGDMKIGCGPKIKPKPNENCDPPEDLNECVEIKLGCGNTIIIPNPAPLTDGRKNPINLQKPIYDAMNAIRCKNYCDLKASEMTNFDKYLDTTCLSRVFYLGGWGKPVITDSLVDVFETLIKAGKLHLFISGQDLALQMGGPRNQGSISTNITRNFLIDYLQANFVDNGDSTRKRVVPYLSDPYFGMLPSAELEPVYQTATALNLIPDRASANSSIGNYFLRFNNTTPAGTYGNIEKYKFVYMTVGPEMFVSDTTFLKSLVRSILNYFDDTCKTRILNIKDIGDSDNNSVSIIPTHEYIY
ncbi:MAG: Omp28-related outer membrane protein, partial [Saprospiraceae bacterium]|nr:Omp28-related outer membrane protein [Saprospiraceae bacterium]